MKYLKNFEGMKKDQEDYKRQLVMNKPGINVYSYNEVYVDGTLIGLMPEFGDKDERTEGMDFWTYYIVYADYDDPEEDSIEEIDIYAIPGYEDEVAEAITDAGYDKGYKRIVKADNYRPVYEAMNLENYPYINADDDELSIIYDYEKQGKIEVYGNQVYYDDEDPSVMRIMSDLFPNEV